LRCVLALCLSDSGDSLLRGSSPSATPNPAPRPAPSPPQGLGDRLARLGLFAGGASAAGLVVAYSNSIVDQMPKEGACRGATPGPPALSVPAGAAPCTEPLPACVLLIPPPAQAPITSQPPACTPRPGATAGAAGAPALQEQLSRKGLRHDMLLAALEAGGVLPRLPAAAGAALFAHAEQLAAATGALELLPELSAAVSEGAVGAEGARDAAAAALKAAGALAAAGGPDAYAAGAPWEPFFARPTVGAPALFRAVATEAGALRAALAEHASGGGAFVGAEEASRRLQGLGLLLGRAAGGAEGKRAQLAAAFRDADARQRAAAGSAAAAPASWLFSGDAREAWAALAQASLLLKPRLPSLSARLELDAAVHLPATGYLLTAAREAPPKAPRLSTAGGDGGGGDGGGAGAGAAEEGRRHAGSLLEDAKEELAEMR
jgi:hypothetical protein